MHAACAWGMFPGTQHHCLWTVSALPGWTSKGDQNLAWSMLRLLVALDLGVASYPSTLTNTPMQHTGQPQARLHMMVYYGYCMKVYHIFFIALAVLCCTVCTAGPDLGEFITGHELAEKYSVEAPSWKVCQLRHQRDRDSMTSTTLTVTVIYHCHLSVTVLGVTVP